MGGASTKPKKIPAERIKDHFAAAANSQIFPDMWVENPNLAAQLLTKACHMLAPLEEKYLWLIKKYPLCDEIIANYVTSQGYPQASHYSLLEARILNFMLVQTISSKLFAQFYTYTTYLSRSHLQNFWGTTQHWNPSSLILKEVGEFLKAYCGLAFSLTKNASRQILLENLSKKFAGPDGTRYAFPSQKHFECIVQLIIPIEQPKYMAGWAKISMLISCGRACVSNGYLPPIFHAIISRCGDQSNELMSFILQLASLSSPRYLITPSIEEENKPNIEFKI